jgi:type II secretory pathway pseudopilin PulG
MRRGGITLLEVVISLAIFMVSLVAIGSLISTGSDRARDVQLQAQALFLCQGKLAELNAGIEPLSAQKDAAFPNLPDWHWSADCAQNGEVSGLWDVTVRVAHVRPDGSRLEVSLSQLVLDPSLRGSASDQAATASSTAEQPAQSGETGASSGNTGGGK